MFKLLKGFLMLLGLAIVLVLGGLWYALSEEVYVRVVDEGTALTGTAIALDRADCIPVNGHLSLNELVIANPHGFRSSFAMRWGDIQATTRPFSLLDGTLAIDSLTLTDGEIAMEGSNLTRIQNHLTGMAGDEGSQTTLTINAIHITGCKVHHINTKTGAIQRTRLLPDIHLQTYGKGKAAEVLAELWGDVLQIVESE